MLPDMCHQFSRALCVYRRDECPFVLICTNAFPKNETRQLRSPQAGHDGEERATNANAKKLKPAILNSPGKFHANFLCSPAAQRAD